MGIDFSQRLDDGKSGSFAAGQLDAVFEATGYYFCDGGLLDEAFTHASATAHTKHRNLNRLEFLGDAVIDLTLAIFALELEPNASPSRLSDYRFALCSTDSLALVCQHHGLQKRLIHFSKPLAEQMTAFCEKSHQEQDLWLLAAAPKTLADICESLIGAVYADSHFQLDIALAAARRLCGPVWLRILQRNNGGPPLNPVRLANERFGPIAKVSWDEPTKTLYCGNFPLSCGGQSRAEASLKVLRAFDEKAMAILRQHLASH